MKRRLRAAIFLLGGLVLSLSATVQAAPLAYDLKPRLIAPDTYIVEGALEDFNRDNGGNIVNTAFIVTDEGVLVFDSGPSRRYGKALREAIAGVTDQPVTHLINSHQHPDHILGNQAFSDATIWALPATGEQIARNGNAFAENMYQMVGDWMRGTEVVLPTRPLMEEGFALGNHRLRFMAFSGHTGSDLVMLDEATGVLFAADMVFYQRALTTPHTPGLKIWQEELGRLAALPYRLMVPGHGPVVDDDRAIEQMVDYLRWLDGTLADAAERGLSMSEVMRTELPPELQTIRLSQQEFKRSVVHLYPQYEEAAF